MRDAALPLDEEVEAPPLAEVAAPPIAEIAPPPLAEPPISALPAILPVERATSWYAWISEAPSWLVSLTLHLVVLLFLGVATYQGMQGVDVLELILHEPTPDEESGQELSAVTLETTDALADLQESLGEDANNDEGELTPPPDLNLAAAEMVGDLAAVEYFHPQAFQRRKSPNKQTVGDTKGQQTGARAEFFGIEATGRDFVFIVDCSGSMKGARLAEAKNELLYALERLDTTQNFYIYFFSSGPPIAMFEGLPYKVPREPVAATHQNIEKVRRWLNKIKASGGTDPTAATERAIDMQPDAIYLLTDGKLGGGSKLDQVITKKNIVATPAGDEVRVVIHTIGLHNSGGEPVLSAIARQCGGTYQFVPAPDSVPVKK